MQELTSCWLSWFRKAYPFLYQEEIGELIDLRKASKSIITRLILFGLAIALVTATGRYFMMTDFLREDLAKVVSIQQEALATYVAHDIDLKISGRLQTLNRLAEIFPLELIKKPNELRIWLERLLPPTEN